MDEEEFIEAPALNGIDPRLRSGIPFLVPVGLRNIISTQSESKHDLLLLRLDYHYLNQKNR